MQDVANLSGYSIYFAPIAAGIAAFALALRPTQDARSMRPAGFPKDPAFSLRKYHEAFSQLVMKSYKLDKPESPDTADNLAILTFAEARPGSAKSQHLLTSSETD